MKQGLFRKGLPHIAAVLIFLIVSVVYCKPALEGKVLFQSDTHGWRGMAQQSIEYSKEHGHFPLWTNSMFSGMPAYQIAMDPQLPVKLDNIVHKILTLGLPEPASYFFLACICFYLLCVVAGANPWISIMGGIAYAFSTYDPIIISVGHNTKMISIAYAPAVLSGLLLLFQKRYWTGFALTALFSMQLIIHNHLQTVYYTLLVAVFICIAYLVKSIREKQASQVIAPFSLAIIAGLIGAAACAINILPTYELTKETMRGGKSEVTIGQEKGNQTKGGLDKTYAFNWSYGQAETFTFLVPGLYGGGNTGSKEFPSSSKFAEKLTELGFPEDAALQNANASAYWGEQPNTSGPVYLGAVICLLFVLGLVYLKSWHKWWIIGITVFAILLAWGKNFAAFNYFLFDYLPFYNKFRAPTTSLIIPQLTFPLLAVLTLSQLTDKETDWDYTFKKLKLAGLITGGLLLIMALFYFSASFKGSSDLRLKEQFTHGLLQQLSQGGRQPGAQQVQQVDDTVNSLLRALQDDRQAHMGSDLLRSFVLIALAFGALWLFVKRKLPVRVLIGAMLVLVAFDLVGIATRYLNSDSYIEKSDEENAFNLTAADQQILADPDHANFRVFNQSVSSPFEESATSYHHNSIGGYLPARLAYYNDLMMHQLYKGNMNVYNMLNAKYFITRNPSTGQPVAQLNPAAFGNAWFVKQIKWVDDANEDISALDSTDLKEYAIIDRRYEKEVQQNFQYDSTATIRLTKNSNDTLVYAYNAASPQFVVFSEIYYDKGWNAFIDGQKAPYVRVNYALRGMNVDKGQHTIEFRFEPQSYKTGRKASMIGHMLVFFALLAAAFFSVRKKKLA